MNPVTKILKEQISRLENRPPVKINQLPNGIRTLEDRIVFSVIGAVDCDSVEFKIEFYQDAIKDLANAIHLLQQDDDTEPEEEPIIEEKPDGTVVNPHTGKPILRYGEKIESDNKFTEETDNMLKELETITTKKANRTNFVIDNSRRRI